MHADADGADALRVPPPAVTRPHGRSGHGLVALQGAIGNRAVTSLVRPKAHRAPVDIQRAVEGDGWSDLMASVNRGLDEMETITMVDDVTEKRLRDMPFDDLMIFADRFLKKHGKVGVTLSETEKRAPTNARAAWWAQGKRVRSRVETVVEARERKEKAREFFWTWIDKARVQLTGSQSLDLLIVLLPEVRRRLSAVLDEGGTVKAASPQDKLKYGFIPKDTIDTIAHGSKKIDRAYLATQAIDAAAVLTNAFLGKKMALGSVANPATISAQKIGMVKSAKDFADVVKNLRRQIFAANYYLRFERQTDVAGGGDDMPRIGALEKEIDLLTAQPGTVYSVFPFKQPDDPLTWILGNEVSNERPDEEEQWLEAMAEIEKIDEDKPLQANRELEIAPGRWVEVMIIAEAGRNVRVHMPGEPAAKDLWVPRSQVRPKRHFEVGDTAIVKAKNKKRYPAKVLAISGEEATVHFYGYPASDDESVWLHQLHAAGD